MGGVGAKFQVWMGWDRLVGTGVATALKIVQNELSKSDKDVGTDNNFVIDHTFPFLDTRLSRLDNKCNW